MLSKETLGSLGYRDWCVWVQGILTAEVVALFVLVVYSFFFNLLISHPGIPWLPVSWFRNWSAANHRATFSSSSAHTYCIWQRAKDFAARNLCCSSLPLFTVSRCHPMMYQIFHMLIVFPRQFCGVYSSLSADIKGHARRFPLKFQQKFSHVHAAKLRLWSDQVLWNEN